MQLDLFTILAVESAVCLLFALWLGAYSALSGSLPGMRWFTAAFVLFGTTTLLSAPRGILPDSVTLVTAHASLCSGMACFHEGLLKQLQTRRNLPGLGVALCAAGTLSAYLLGVWHDLIAPRIIVSCLIMIIFSLVGFARIRRHAPVRASMAPYMRVTGALLGIVILSSFMRIFLNTLAPLPADRLWAGALQSAPHLGYLAFLLGSALNLVWMSLNASARSTRATP